jgi:hypothetical protein
MAAAGVDVPGVCAGGDGACLMSLACKETGRNQKNRINEIVTFISSPMKSRTKSISEKIFIPDIICYEFLQEN